VACDEVVTPSVVEAAVGTPATGAAAGTVGSMTRDFENELFVVLIKADLLSRKKLFESSSGCPWEYNKSQPDNVALLFHCRLVFLLTVDYDCLLSHPTRIRGARLM